MTCRLCLLVTATATLIGCGGAGDETIIPDPPPPVTFSTSAIAITEQRLANTLNYARNQNTAITGSANFIGGFLADLEVDFEPGQSLVGNIDLTMNFNARNSGQTNVTGRMFNFGIADENGVATEGVLGTIPLSGTVGAVAVSVKPDGIPGSGSPGDTRVAQNILQVSGAGTLTGTFGQDRLETVPVDLDMIGHARTRTVSQQFSDSPVRPSAGFFQPDDDWFSGVIGGDGQGAYDLFFNGRFYVFEE